MRSRVRYRLQGKRERNKHISVIRKFTLLALVGIMIYTMGLFLLEKPKVVNLKEFELIPAKGEKTVKVQGVFGSTKLEVQITQGEKVYKVFSDYINKDKELTLQIDTSSAGMKEGPAKVVIKLIPNVLFTRNYSINSYIDAKAPNIELVSLTNPVKQGLVGVIKLRIEDAKSAYLKVGEQRYNLYSMDDKNYLALFPIESSGKLNVRVFAIDRAGNISQRDFTLTALPSNVEKVFNVQANEDLTSKSEPRKLWIGSFLKPSKSNVIAANNGVVVAVYKNRDNTQRVIIDHGLGLMSVYEFLDKVDVNEGEYVKKGYVIGKASKNFRFGILAQGKEIQVFPWFDDKWLYENVERFLK